MTRIEIPPSAGNYTLVVVDNESIAWKALQLESYDLLITSRDRSPTSGLAMLRRIHAVGSNLPVIMGSSVMLPERPERALQMIVEATLIKPYTLQEFLAVVKEILLATNDKPSENSVTAWPGQPPADATRNLHAGARR